MHNRADRPAAATREQAGSGTHGSMRLATVTPFTRARQRRQTSTRARRGVVIGRPDSLCAWLLQLLDTASCDGTVRATLHSSTTWADLTDTARTDSRIEVAALADGLEEAVESASPRSPRSVPDPASTSKSRSHRSASPSLCAACSPTP